MKGYHHSIDRSLNNKGQKTVIGYINVTSTAKTIYNPDIAKLILNISVLDNNMNAAYNKVSELTKFVEQRVNANSLVSDIETINFDSSVKTEYNEAQKKLVNVGYIVTHQLQLTVNNAKKVNLIISLIMSIKSNHISIQNIYYGSDDLLENKQLETLSKAMKKAYMQARSIMSVSELQNYTIGYPLEIKDTVNHDNINIPRSYISKSTDVVDQNQISLYPSKLSTHATISVRFSII